jgi:hypothetical protein
MQSRTCLWQTHGIRKYYMDTDIFDTEISVINITKSYIELSTSRIHQNMIRKLRSFNSKSVHSLILAVSIIAVIFAAQQQAQASSDRESNPNDNAWQAGWKEGKNDYLNGDDYEYSCSSDLGDTYCSAYRDGYEIGWYKQQDLGREFGSDPR